MTESNTEPHPNPPYHIRVFRLVEEGQYAGHYALIYNDNNNVMFLDEWLESEEYDGYDLDSLASTDGPFVRVVTKRREPED